MPSHPQYKFYYFDIRGLGETTRMIFAQAGVQFEDARVKREDWPNIKNDMPFGQMPVLEIDGKEKIAQSGAIYRYLGRKFGMAGKTPIEEAKVDMIGDLFKDFSNEIRDYFRVAVGFLEGDKEEKYKSVFVPAVDKYVTFLEKSLKDAGSGFFVGSNVTWVDIQIAESAQRLEEIAGHPELFDKYPLFKAHTKHILELDHIKKYIATRPKTPY